MLDTLFFDGDQTLWDFDKQMRRALQATLEELQAKRPELPTSELDVESMVADRQAVGRQHDGLTMERLRRLSFERTLTRLGGRDNQLADHLTEFYLEQRFSTADLYPERFGLGGFFTAVVFAQDHGFRKPDRRLFDVAAAKIGSSAASIAMVGDSLTNDVTGAQAAGWLGIWVNRERAVSSPDHQPNAEVDTLTELPAVVAGQCLALRDQTKQ